MKDIQDESFVSVMEYRTKWRKIENEIREVWGMYLTEDGHFWGLTDYVMRKMQEARDEGKQDALKELENRIDEDES